MKSVFPVIKRAKLKSAILRENDEYLEYYVGSDVYMERLSRAKWARKLAERKERQIKNLRVLVDDLRLGTKTRIWLKLLIIDLEEERDELLRVAQADAPESESARVTVVKPRFKEEDEKNGD